MPTSYHRISLWVATLALLRTLAPPLVCVLALFVATQQFGEEFSGLYVALALVSGLLVYIVMRPRLSDEWAAFVCPRSIAESVITRWLAVVVTLLAIGHATDSTSELARPVLLAWIIATPVLTIALLIVLRGWLRRELGGGWAVRSAVIVGVNAGSVKLARSIESQPELGFSFRGFFDDRSPARLGEDIDSSKLLGKLEQLTDYVRREGIDTIFIALPVSYMRRTRNLLDRLRDTTASVYFVPNIYSMDLIRARTDHFSGIPLVALYESPFYGWQGLVKRASDLVIAGAMLVVCLPLMIAIAIGVKLTTPGSVIFRQTRYGLGGERITVYKFRTMTVSEDGEQVAQATRGDARTTPFGAFLRRYSLDELPQLVNVLQGRMSVVGPRPHAVAHNEQYRKVIDGYMLRHKVTPGITGLAQVSGFRGETRNVEEMEQRIRYDLQYLREWTLMLDFKILLRTLAVMFGDDRAY